MSVGRRGRRGRDAWRVVSGHVIVGGRTTTYLPKRAPTNEGDTQVLDGRGVLNEAIDLLGHAEGGGGVIVAAREFVLNAAHDFERALIACLAFDAANFACPFVFVFVSIGSTLFGIGVGDETPRDQRIVHECLEEGQYALAIIAEHAHGVFRGDLKGALDATDFHGLDQHARETEWHFFGELGAVAGDLEAVAEVDVDDFARVAVEQQVGGVPVAETQDVADDRGGGERAHIRGAALEPCLGRARLEPQNAVQVLTGCVVERVLEHLDLLQHGEAVVVGRHLEHEAVLDVEQDLVLLAVFLDEHVQRVAVSDPPQHACVGRQRNDGEAAQTEAALVRLGVDGQQRIDETKELHDALVLPHVLVALEQVLVRAAVAAADLEAARALLGRNHEHDRLKLRDAHDGLATHIRAWHSELQIAHRQQLGRDVLQGQLHGIRGGQLLGDALEYMVVQIPGLIQVVDLTVLAVPPHVLACLVQVAPVRLRKRRLTQRLGAALEQIMQRSERRKHALDIVLGKVQTRRLFETLVPHFVPQDGDADQLVAYEQRLLDQHGAVLPHRIHDAHRRLHAHGRRRLGRDGQRVHERLRMGRADVRQEVVDEAADAR